MSKERDSKKRIAFVQLFAEAAASAVPDEIHVVPTGKWDHPVYGEMEITPADISEFVQNFSRNVRLDIPITQGHDNGMGGTEAPAIGWFTELFDRGAAGLYAGVRWTDEGKQLLTNGSFKYFSPEFYEQYSDPETGVKYGHVLVGGALTNKPYFKELDPVATFSEPELTNQFSEYMKLKDIVAKKPTDLIDEEKAFLREHSEELTTEQKLTFDEVLEDATAEESDEERQAREEKEQGDANEEAGLNRDGTAKQVVASEKGMVTLTEAQYNLLARKADKGQEAFSQVETMKLETEVDKLVFSTTNTEGKILPKSKPAVVAFMKSLSEKQRDQFRTIVNSLPARDSKLFKELGDGGKENTAGTKASEMESAIQEAIKASEGKLTYSQAVEKVTKENPRLASEYNAEMSGGAIAETEQE